MQILNIDADCARCISHGIEREVNLFMLQHENLVPGDFVLVHVGYAIQKLLAEDAAQTWQLFDRMLTQDHTDA